jgi:hypothetical protein
MVNFAEIMDAEDMQATARQALDGCSNKTVDYRPGSRFGDPEAAEQGYTRMLELVCPKYPEGTEFVTGGHINNNVARARAALRLGCAACEFKNGNPEKAALEAQVSALHGKIREIPGKLYVQGNHTEAVFRGFVTVKETLREASGGYETATDAVGQGGLYFVNKRGEHVDRPYQQAAKFSLMAVDNLRNVEAHSLPHDDEIAQGAEYSYPRLMLCSLALNFLDATEIRK